MRRLAILVLVLITACGPTPTVVPSASPVTSDIPVPITVVPQVTIPNSTPQPTVTTASAPTTSGNIWLQALSPLDETVVNTSQVDVTGSAPAGSVISVNDVILIVGSDGQFKTTVALDEGPNLIEIVASDENGNELSMMLTVTYEP